MRARTPLPLEQIYLPIEREIGALHRFLDEEFGTEEPFIVELLHHVARYRGKQIRPALLLLISRSYGPVREEHTKIAAVIELIHTATLVHDDVLDGAEIRRKAETVHRRWGERAAVLLGDFIYSRAFTLSTEVPGMARLFAQTTHTICEGELLQIGQAFCPDIGEEGYFEIIRKKTAILYAISCRLGASLAGAPATEADLLNEFGLQLGMAFQIVDDCLDVSGDEARMGKTLGTDLRGGKATLPLIYLLERAPGRDEFRGMLRRPPAPNEEAMILDAVQTSGALEAAFRRAEDFVREAKGVLVGISDPTLRESLDHIADYVLLRSA